MDHFLDRFFDSDEQCPRHDREADRNLMNVGDVPPEYGYVPIVKTMSGVHEHAQSMGSSGGIREDLRLLELVVARKGVGKFARVKFNGVCSYLSGGFDLLGHRIDE